jgi:hypothetical protein
MTVLLDSSRILLAGEVRRLAESLRCSRHGCTSFGFLKGPPPQPGKLLHKDRPYLDIEARRMPEIQSQWSVCAALATFRDDVRAENRIHGSDQQSCSLDVLRVMITIMCPRLAFLPITRLAAWLQLSRRKETWKTRDLDPAPPARRPADRPSTRKTAVSD